MTKPRRPEPKNESDRDFFEMIDEHGWAVTAVGPTEDDEGPTFAYTTGIYEKLRAPELIVFGLDLKVMMVLCNDYGNRIEAGENFQDNTPYEDFLQGYPVEFRFVNMQRPEATGEYLCFSDWYYFREKFPALQMVWPDKNGLFPWELGFTTELREFQPLLDQPILQS